MIYNYKDNSEGYKYQPDDSGDYKSRDKIYRDNLGTSIRFYLRGKFLTQNCVVQQFPYMLTCTII